MDVDNNPGNSGVASSVPTLDPNNLNAYKLLRDLRLHIRECLYGGKVQKLFVPGDIEITPIRLKQPEDKQSMSPLRKKSNKENIPTDKKQQAVESKLVTYLTKEGEIRYSVHKLTQSYCGSDELSKQLSDENIFDLYKDVLNMPLVVHDLINVDEYSGLLKFEAEKKDEIPISNFGKILTFWYFADEFVCQKFGCTFFELLCNAYRGMDNTTGTICLSLLYIWILKNHPDTIITLSKEHTFFLQLPSKKFTHDISFQVVDFLHSNGFINTHHFLSRILVMDSRQFSKYISKTGISKKMSYLDLMRYLSVLDSVALFNALLVMNRCKEYMCRRCSNEEEEK